MFKASDFKAKVTTVLSSIPASSDTGAADEAVLKSTNPKNPTLKIQNYPLLKSFLFWQGLSRFRDKNYAKIIYRYEQYNVSCFRHKKTVDTTNFPLSLQGKFTKCLKNGLRI